MAAAINFIVAGYNLHALLDCLIEGRHGKAAVIATLCCFNLFIGWLCLPSRVRGAA
jgi:hypothetical protein